MSDKKQYKSEALASIHETMGALHQVGAIDKKTMRNFDADCLEVISEIKPKDIRDIRKRENASQPVFAMYLNVSKNLVSDWERGIKKPGGPALRLINIVKKHGLNALT